MKVGFHTVALHSRPLADACIRIGDAGYEAVELNAERLPWAEPHLTPTTPPDVLEAARRACNKANVVVSSICAHIPLVSSDPKARSSSVAYVKGCIDLAPRFTTDIVHVISGPPDPALSSSDNWRQFVEALEELAHYASAKRVRLGVEAVVGQVCSSVSHLQHMFSDLNDVEIFLNFDPSHFIVQWEDPAEVVRRFGDRIIHVHLKDGKGRHPDFAFPPLGEGNIRFPGLISDLRSAGYSGVLSVEYEAQIFGYTQKEEEILARSLTFARQALNASH
jgi:sugar phosphate isomerase/epimerase